MKSVHPFPARMAPELLDKLLGKNGTGRTVFDPMAGSGTVVRLAAQAGMKAIGSDSDPLAVLMTSVATSQVREKSILNATDYVLNHAKRYGFRSRTLLANIEHCAETKAFVRFWFARRQIRELNALSKAINSWSERHNQPSTTRLLRLAMSRLIVTKNVGASLAADVSHSRPHKVRQSNDFKVIESFEKSVCIILNAISENNFSFKPQVFCDDARLLRRVQDQSIDAIVTSPPYLNALDYVRGHKLSLVWMGETIPSLRALRSTNVGTESSRVSELAGESDSTALRSMFPELSELSERKFLMVRRYVTDLDGVLVQYKRVLKNKSELHVVIGNSCLGSVFIKNSEFFAYCARKLGFQLVEQWERELPTNRRYLPITVEKNPLAMRMRREVVQSYRLTK